jgi:hypothetical protein
VLSIEPTELLAKDRAGARYLNLPCLIVSGFHCRFVFNRPAPSGLEAKLGDCIILKPNVLKTKLPGLERYCDLRVFLPMSSDHIIVDAIKVAQNLLSPKSTPGA